MRLRRYGALGFASALVVASGLAVGGGSATAHDDDPHPAHIHVGTCDSPGEVVIPLSDISHDYLVDGEASAGDAVGQETGIPTQGSVTTADVALADIIEGGHVLMVHESAEDIGTYVACGDVGGTMMGENDLVIGVKTLNDSGLSGVAMLHDNGDDTTTISVYLTEGEEAAAGGDEGDAGGEIAVSIVDFSFDAAELEVAAGTTVTWTNNDSAPHTVTARDGSFQSGTMQSGDTFSHTFADAGSFEYFCEFHANMVASVTVA